LPQPGPLPQPQPQPTPLRPLKLRLPKRGVRLSRNGLISFKVANPQAAAWRGKVVLASADKLNASRRRARRVTFGGASVVLAGHTRRVLRFQLSAANLRLIERLGEVNATITLTPRGQKPGNGVRTTLLARR
jgi:hypothetical protein